MLYGIGIEIAINFAMANLNITSFYSVLIVFAHLSAFAGPTDLQVLMTPKKIPHTDLIQKHNLIRLWPLDSLNKGTRKLDIEDSVFGTTQKAKTISRSAGVKSMTCNEKNYAYFDHGVIVSNESFLIQDILKNASQSLTRRLDLYSVKKGVFLSTKIGVAQIFDAYTQLHSPDLTQDISKVENQKAIENSTSLVHVAKDRKDRFAIEKSDYTLGGWFKPRSEKAISLFAKYFTNIKTRQRQKEWEIFSTGNMIYFHVYHDYEVSAEHKYMDTFEARKFREENERFYEPTDFYTDILAKQNTLKEAIQNYTAAQPQKLTKVFVDIPIAHKLAKPIGEPVIEPPPNPIVIINPPIILPPGPAPKPPRFREIIPIGYGGSGKEHTFDFDMKHFWWGSNSFLGGCYGCVQSGIDHDVWHFFSVSAKMDDPLGPYLDILIIRDPNEKKFGNKATTSSHFRTMRFELDREMNSRPAKSVITHAFLTENACPMGERCTTSELEIGSSDNMRPYSGFMRGVFMAKKALNQASLLEIAAEFNPQDDSLCTYLKP